jgi:hypothetical protein
MDRIDPEIEWRDDAMLVDGRALRGIDEIEGHFRDVLSFLGDPKFIVEDLHDRGTAWWRECASSEGRRCR